MSKHFKLILPDEGYDVYMPRKSQSWGYRYGPTIMVEGDVCHAWFASPGDCFEADWFTYRRSVDGGKTWTDERVVMAPVPDSMDWFSVCDPAVVKYGEWYYMGYTSTIFESGGGICNNGYVSRSKNPDGPFERWTGSGWGETRETEAGTLRWMGQPAPLIYYDEDWHCWGAGELSFVIKDDVIYVYYTWNSKDLDGRGISETRVATADITDENWPAHLVMHGTAMKRLGGGNDSCDMVYCEDLDKFVALSTDCRFSENSYLAVFESDDGLRYNLVNCIKQNTGRMCHNCGISGDAHHHIKSGDTMLLAYAYGGKWGCWATRLHDYSFEAMTEELYDERPLQNVHHELNCLPNPDEFRTAILYLGDHHRLRLRPGTSAHIPTTIGNSLYEMRRMPGGVTYSNYDPAIVEIKGDTAYAKREGYTYVRADRDGCFCEFLITVTADLPLGWQEWQPYPDKRVVAFDPIATAYTASLSGRDMKQLRGMATYEDGCRFELCGGDGVTYENHAPELFTVRPDGNVIPTGKLGEGRVTLSCGGCSFDVRVIVGE